MKSFLIIGMGRFGHHLAEDFIERGHSVMAIDINEDNIRDVVNTVTSVKIADCTNNAVLESLGIGNFDVVFVCIGTNFQSSLEITSLVKEMGAQWVVSRATRDIQAKFLLRNGADEVVYPEKDIAQRSAAKYSVKNIFDYIELTKGYAIYEICPLKKWIGKSIRTLDIAANYHISILGTKKGHERNIMPSADYIIQDSEHLIVLASDLDIMKVINNK